MASPEAKKKLLQQSGTIQNQTADPLSGYIDEVRFCASALLPEQFLNAFNPDTDDDGLEDAWEIDNFGNLDQTGTDDPDQDGDDNETEETNGTPPTISSLEPDLESAFTNGLFTLNWPDYHTGWHLEYRTNLMDGAWQPVPDSDSANAFLFDPETVPYPDVFFRLVYP